MASHVSNVLLMLSFIHLENTLAVLTLVNVTSTNFCDNMNTRNINTTGSPIKWECSGTNYFSDASNCEEGNCMILGGGNTAGECEIKLDFTGYANIQLTYTVNNYHPSGQNAWDSVEPFRDGIEVCYTCGNDLDASCTNHGGNGTLLGFNGDYGITYHTFNFTQTCNHANPIRVHFRCDSSANYEHSHVDNVCFISTISNSTNQPTTQPTSNPTSIPTIYPSIYPTVNPSAIPTTANPTDNPTEEPSVSPTKGPSAMVTEQTVISERKLLTGKNEGFKYWWLIIVILILLLLSCVGVFVMLYLKKKRRNDDSGKDWVSMTSVDTPMGSIDSPTTAGTVGTNTSAGENGNLTTNTGGNDTLGEGNDTNDTTNVNEGNNVTKGGDDDDVLPVDATEIEEDEIIVDDGNITAK